MTSVEGYTAPYKTKMHPTTINNISLVDIFGLILAPKSQFANTKLFAPTFICAGCKPSFARAAAENGLAVMNTESTSNDHHWQFTSFNSLLKNCKPINYTMQ